LSESGPSAGSGPLRGQLGLVGWVLGALIIGLGTQAGCRTSCSVVAGDERKMAWDGFGSAVCYLPATSDERGSRLLVGAPTASRSGEDPTGALYEVAWPGGGVKAVRWGTAPHEGFAESLCLLRDLNGDGVPEVAVGCPGASGDAGDGCGKVEILSGRDFTRIREVWGTKTGQRFGTRVTSSGEVGSPDSGVVGVLLEDPVSTLKGAVVFNADMTARRWEIAPKGDYEGLGTALLPCPDLDGDGVPEIGVPQPLAVKDRRVVGRYSINSGKSGRVLFECWGSEEYEFFGTSASVVAPMEAADRFMLVIGSLQFTRDARRTGRVRVIGVPSNRLVHERLGTAHGGAFGVSVVALGEASNSSRPAKATIAVAAGRAPETRSSERSSIAGGGYVEGIRVGEEAPAFHIEGVQPRGRLGDSMTWVDAERLLVLGAPGSFDIPALRQMKSQSYLCVLSVAEAVQKCRVFTSQGEVARGDLGRFVRLD
jgi:hypothetical protein